MITCLHTQKYEFYRNFEQAGFYYPASGIVIQSPVNILSIGSYICRVGSAEKGHIEQFIEAMTRAIPHAMVTINGCMYGYDDLAQAEVSFFREEMSNAEQFALAAIYKAREKKQYEIESRALFYLLRISLSFGNYDKIQDILKQLEGQLGITEYARRYVLYDIITGWFYAQIEQTDQLPEWLKNDFEGSDLNSLIHGTETLVRVKYQLLGKQYPAALATLSDQTNLYGVYTYLLGKIFKHAAEAVCYYKMKRTEQSLQLLETAYTLAEPNSFTMPFIELGKDMRCLVGVALESPDCAIPKPWLEKLYRKSAAYAKKLFAVMEKYQAPDQQRQTRITTLSPRELDILTCLSQGLTREEIANVYHLSVNTVKSVITSIYTKLGAVNRADAIRIATTLGILKK
jgi:LuxR family maltose regulon positive regulatory protein